jgi:hypothetical protein
VRSKCAPAKAEKTAVEAANLVFQTEKKLRDFEYYKGEKAVVPLLTETKPLFIHHDPDMERPLASLCMLTNILDLPPNASVYTLLTFIKMEDFFTLEAQICAQRPS